MKVFIALACLATVASAGLVTKKSLAVRTTCGPDGTECPGGCCPDGPLGCCPWHCAVPHGMMVGCFKNMLKSEGECVYCMWVELVLYYRRALSLTYNAFIFVYG